MADCAPCSMSGTYTDATHDVVRKDGSTTQYCAECAAYARDLGLEVRAHTTPADILAAGAPEQAATLFLSWLKQSQDAADAVLWTPERASELGYGRCWTVCWEGGLFEWASSVSMGCTLHAGESGTYSELGPFANGLLNPRKWHTEPYNTFILGFYED